MDVSLQGPRNSGWNSDTSVTPFNVPLMSLAAGKEMTIDIPAMKVSGLMWRGSADRKGMEVLTHPRDTHCLPPGSRIFQSLLL
jgi:hypothetical protein